MSKKIKLIGEFDASVWAKEFIRIFAKRKKDIDEELMIGWFANSIMAGYDKARAERKPQPIRGFDPEEELNPKTLKDLGKFRTKFNLFIPDSEIGKFIHKGELKQEAIKWVKEDEPYPASPQKIMLMLTPEAKDWIKYFFNITEDDLK